ncbi:MAG: radical SAM family heme chaperone HemW [SAR202 cluster bacterium]|jgi:oxygen-independent coproporphyrinogen-3 oxidase|nr:radical SAM family heme chaperone HemW [SAR202 cluster bacterium]MDP6713493.1 radical SAM family heme chaperone HemW [SAR202 cluster bacterium]
MFSAPPIALYIHIPFCETKCPYCDFNTYARIEPLMPGYVAALIREIELWGDLLEHPTVRTVFFGGGTPSYLPSEDISQIMQTANRSFKIEEGAEVTLEANPGDFTPDKLTTYLESGINRLSIGVQTFDDHLLGLLGRRHSAQGALDAYRMAQDAGFDNISIDLMYGLPEQTLEGWESTLEKMLELRPTHISMYCLTLEEGTPFEAWVRLGRMSDPDPDLAADMYEMAQDAMSDAGYRHYEISNWARDGLESRHNLIYWRTEPYIGVGPGAHSYLGDIRFANLNQPREYISRLMNAEGGKPGRDDAEVSDLKKTIDRVPSVDTTEHIDRSLAMAETLMMGLRLDDGISIPDFRARFNQTPSEAYESTIADLTNLGLLKTSDDRLLLTPRGRILGNEVFSRFFE